MASGKYWYEVIKSPGQSQYPYQVWYVDETRLPVLISAHLTILEAEDERRRLEFKRIAADNVTKHVPHIIAVQLPDAYGTW